MSRLKKILKERKWVALDTETYGNIKKKEITVWHPSIRLAYISYWDSTGKGEVISYRDNPDYVISTVERFFQDDYTIIFWNAPFDLAVLAKEELRPSGCCIQDAMVLAQTVHPTEREFGLKHFARKLLRVPYLEEDNLKAYLRKNKCDYGSAPYDVIAPYALADAQYTFELYYMMIRHIDRLKMWDTWELETKVQAAVLKMMRNGIRIDPQRVHDLELAAHGEMRKLKAQIVREIGNPKINLNSPAQIAAALWPGGKNAPRRTKTGKPSTNNLSLLLDGRPVARKIQRFRSYDKALGNYYRALSTLPQHGVLHCGLNQNKAVTGRFSSSGPNLQNQPRPSSSPLGRIRECFIPLDTNSILTLIDYDQIELRLAAHFAQEEHMLEAIRKGEDLHDVTRERMHGLRTDDPEKRKSNRYVAKKLNFSTLYGTGPEKFAASLLEDTGGIVRITESQARDFIDQWWDTHPGIQELRNRVLSEIARTGGVRTAFGRYIPVLPGKEHAALNYLIQGTAADVIKRAIVSVHSFLKKERVATLMLLPVHDELIFNMPREEKYLVLPLVERMEDRTNFEVPLTCSVEAGLRWGKKKPVTIRRRTE